MTTKKSTCVENSRLPTNLAPSLGLSEIYSQIFEALLLHQVKCNNKDIHEANMNYLPHIVNFGRTCLRLNLWRPPVHIGICNQKIVD